MCCEQEEAASPALLVGFSGTVTYWEPIGIYGGLSFKVTCLFCFAGGGDLCLRSNLFVGCHMMESIE